MALRYVAVLLLALLGLWLYAGQPSPDEIAQLLTADRDVPISEPSPAERQALEQAVGMTRMHESPEREALRQALLDAYRRLGEAPCDDGLQREFGAAAVPFVAAAMGKRRLPSETVTIDGKELSASPILERDVNLIIGTILFDGRIEPENLPPSIAAEARRITMERGGFKTCTG